MYRHIRDLREDADLTQQQIAELLNVTQAAYSQYESGSVDIPSSSLIKPAGFYSTSVDNLLGPTSGKTPYKQVQKPSGKSSNSFYTLFLKKQSQAEAGFFFLNPS